MWDDGPLEGPRNMARDHALALVAPAGYGFLRFYRWRRPTLSFGRHESVHDAWRRDQPEALGWDVVRRPTGGRTVLHASELTYSVVVPQRAVGGARHLYRSVHEGLAAGLTRLGVPVEVASRRQRAPGLDAGPCFAVPVDGELEVAGRKLVGSAQARIGSALLQHGSLLLSNQQGLLMHSAEPRRSARPGQTKVPRPVLAGVVALDELMLELPSLADLIAKLGEGLAQTLPGVWPNSHSRALPDTLPAEFTTAEARLLRHYRDSEWTWRR